MKAKETEKEVTVSATSESKLPLYEVGQCVHFFDEDGPQKEKVTACVCINHLYYYSCQIFYSADDVRPAIFMPESKLFESREALIAAI